MRGSQKWLQIAVNEHPEALSRPIAKAIGEDAGSIEWLSPLADDAYAEYRDQAFLNRLAITLDHRRLDSFWPRRGPQWDGLGRTAGGDLLLVEAKAHVAEMVSPATQASEQSLSLINESLGETRNFLGVRESADWSAAYYQYTNRLAHLYLLRGLNRLPAWLVFVYFIGDNEMGGPAVREEWESAIKVMHSVLGLQAGHELSPHVVDLFVDVRQLV